MIRWLDKVRSYLGPKSETSTVEHDAVGHLVLQDLEGNVMTLDVHLPNDLVATGFFSSAEPLSSSVLVAVELVVEKSVMRDIENRARKDEADLLSMPSSEDDPLSVQPLEKMDDRLKVLVKY